MLSRKIYRSRYYFRSLQHFELQSRPEPAAFHRQVLPPNIVNYHLYVGKYNANIVLVTWR